MGPQGHPRQYASFDTVFQYYFYSQDSSLVQLLYHQSSPVSREREKTIKKEARLKTNAIHNHFYCQWLFSYLKDHIRIGELV